MDLEAVYMIALLRLKKWKKSDDCTAALCEECGVSFRENRTMPI